MKLHQVTLVAAIIVSLTAGGAFAQQQEQVFNISGATLFKDFFPTEASTNDFIDVDGDGLITGQPLYAKDDLTQTKASSSSALVNQVSGTRGPGPWWAYQYRGHGSGNGLAEMVQYWDGAYMATATDDLSIGEEPYMNQSYMTETQTTYPGNVWYPSNNTHGAVSGTWGDGANAYNQPADPVPGGNSNDVRVEIAVMDVPTTWFVKDTSSSGAWNKPPASAGYGTNPTATVQGKSNGLKSLDPSSYDAAHTGRPVLNTTGTNPDYQVFDTEVAWVPIGIIANHGAAVGGGTGNVKKTELQHLYVTGRMPSGENLIATTRDSGSGTRNGGMNSLGIDPSWGRGENYSDKNAEVETSPGVYENIYDTIGHDFLPDTKGGSSRMEGTIQNCRMAVGYTGIVGSSRCGADATSGKYEILNVMNDSAGATGTAYVRPVMNAVASASGNNVIFNGDDNTGWQIGGTETFATVGNPFYEDVDYDGNGDIGSYEIDTDGDNIPDITLLAPWEVGNGEGKPMQNHAARDYLRNMKASVSEFVQYVQGAGDPVDLAGTPGQFLAVNYSLKEALQKVPNVGVDGDGNPANDNAGQFVTNPQEVTALQDASVLPTTAIPTTYGTVSYGKVPERDDNPFDFTDAGQPGAGTGHYVTNGGAAVTYGSTMAIGNAVAERNKIQFDANGDGSRNASDISELVRCYRNRTNRGVLDANQSLELQLDANGDGNFNEADMEWAADGLFVRGTAINIKQNYIDMDVADAAQGGNGNLFNVSKATGAAHVAGDARGDIKDAASDTMPGYAPTGDKVIDDADIDYLQDMIKHNDVYVDGDFTDLDQAVGLDLSCDLTGNMVIDQDDVNELLMILDTSIGDSNLDKAVNAPDLTALLASYGMVHGGSKWSESDFNGDGITNAPDLTALLANYGKTSYIPEAAPVTADTPEPGTLALLGLGGLIGLLRRRK